MDVELAKRLGSAAREARQRAGLTQAEVATRIGISPVVYSRLERGLVLPSVPTLLRLCEALQVSASSLLGTPGAKPTAPPVLAASQAPALPAAPTAANLRQLLALISQMDDAQIQALTTVAATLLR